MNSPAPLLPSRRDDGADAIDQWCDRVHRLSGARGEAIEPGLADLLRSELAEAERQLRRQHEELKAARSFGHGPGLAESEQARVVAEAANRAKTQLLATVSHELRTPLAAIGGYADLLTLGIRGPLSADQRQDVDRIHRAKEHMTALLDDLLLYFRLGLGAPSVTVAKASITDVISGLNMFVAPQANARNISIDISPPADAGQVMADVDRARQILINLLTNAVKFSPKGSRIEVAVVDAGEMIDVEVLDHGIGISADRLEAIFEPFVQIPSESAERSGFGLGLSISRKLAELMGGTLVARSAPGDGSCFVLSLRKA